ncbi:MAG: hypothetical protein ACK5LE_08440 [Alphaproteobacteria bacterium]
MLKLKILAILGLTILLGGCFSSNKQSSSNPIVGKWGTTTSCSKSITLQSNRQVQGSAFGTWEERPHIVELSLAQNYQGQRRYVQVLLSKPSQGSMKILRIIYPFENWQWDYQSGDVIVKCR